MTHSKGNLGRTCVGLHSNLFLSGLVSLELSLASRKPFLFGPSDRSVQFNAIELSDWLEMKRLAKMSPSLV